MGTLIDRNTKQLMLAKKQKELDDLFAEQEATRGSQPQQYARGGITPDKAERMLKDGTVRGKKLTARQKAYFGLIAGGGQPILKAGGGLRVPRELNDPQSINYEYPDDPNSFLTPEQAGYGYIGLQPGQPRPKVNPLQARPKENYFPAEPSYDWNTAFHPALPTRTPNPSLSVQHVDTGSYGKIPTLGGTGSNSAAKGVFNSLENPSLIDATKNAKAGIAANSSTTDWGKWGSTAAQLAPVISNLISGLRKDQKLKASDYYNPRANEVMNLMRNRRTNVDPQLQASLNAERTNYYNLHNTANARGELMGNMTAASNNAAGQRSAIYANKQNMDLGYMGDEAQAAMRLGSEEQNANWQTMDYNNQNVANKRNMFRAGLSQLAQYSQNKELMANQLLMDQNRNNIYKDMYSSIAPFMEFMKSFKFSQT
jgi:hypothetical protein